jgi:hypothetical protein
MATIDTVISNARYDLRDTNSTLYTDAELYLYANRALIQLDNVLSAYNSDWIFNETSDTLSIVNNYLAAPTGCMVVRSMWIGTKELQKKSTTEIYRLRKYISSSHEPLYFAHQGANILFECVPDSADTIKIWYDKRATALSTGNDMPYNDEFNGIIREMIILLADKRNENEPMADSEIYNFFQDKAIGNVFRRNHITTKKLDF